LPRAEETQPARRVGRGVETPDSRGDRIAASDERGLGEGAVRSAEPPSAHAPAASEEAVHSDRVPRGEVADEGDEALRQSEGAAGRPQRRYLLSGVDGKPQERGTGSAEGEIKDDA